MKKVLLRAIIVVAAIAAVGLIAWVFVPTALVSLDFGNDEIDDSVRAQAIAANRQSVLLAVGGLIALVGVVVTVSRLYLEREADRRATAAHDLDRDENRTSRYATAIEELGSERPEIQLGGIYALERLAQDSPADKPVIGEVLASFVRTRSTSGESRTEPERAAVLVVARAGFRDLDLTGARLNDLDLSAASFRGFHLIAVDLNGARLDRADLRDATIRDVTCENLRLAQIAFDSVSIQNCTFERLEFSGGTLTNALIEDCAFEGEIADVDFSWSHLTRVSFGASDLLGFVNFKEAVMDSVDLSQLRKFWSLNMRDAQFRGDGLTKLPDDRGAKDRRIELTGATLGTGSKWPTNMEAYVRERRLVFEKDADGREVLRKDVTGLTEPFGPPDTQHASQR